MTDKKRNRKPLIFGLIVILGVIIAWLFWPFANSSYKIVPDQQQIKDKEAFLAEPVIDSANRPNIIILLADDLGKTDIPLYGNKIVKTPNIDSLARDGATFTEAYVSAPICSPSRAGLLTGRYQQRFGYEFQPVNRYLGNRFERLVVNHTFDLQELEFITNNSVPDKAAIAQQGLPEQEITIAELLKKKGYATAITGKWHQGFSAQFSPLKRGFDYFFGFNEAFSWYTDTVNTINSRNKGIMDAHIWELGNSGASQKVRNDKNIDVKGFYTDVLADEATAFIDKNKNKPFFLYVPFNAPHTPFQALKADLKKYQDLGVTDLNKAIYYSLISGLDKAIGRIHQKVKDAGIEKNTLIIFLSDNGGATYTHATDNAPLRGGKMSLYEGGLNVPFVAKWSGQIKPGIVYDKPISSLDIFATVAGVSSSKLPARQYDGVNLIPYLSGQNTAEPHKILYWRSGTNKAIRKGDWKLVLNLKDNISALYNLKSDKNEIKNLAVVNVEKVTELKQDLTAWETTLAQPLWPGTGYYKTITDGKVDRYAL